MRLNHENDESISWTAFGRGDLIHPSSKPSSPFRKKTLVNEPFNKRRHGKRAEKNQTP
jgi:hypothetical protein